MWTHQHDATTEVETSRLWEVLSDVEGWQRWNDGVAQIELHGPVALGSRFTMTMPDGATVQSSIAELEPGRTISDLTELDGIAVLVRHLLGAVGGGRTRITYRIQLSGEAPEETLAQIGTSISADFPEVIAALVQSARDAEPSPTR